MGGTIQSKNYLNTEQLMSISTSIQGVSEESNESVFSQVKSLDTNKNKTIDNGESAISKLIQLGNKVLNRLASMLGISTEKPADNGKMETFEDAQKDSVVSDYFKPFANAGNEAIDNNGVIDGRLDDMVDNDTVKYMFNSIKQEKLSQGVKIVSQSKNQILFNDGTELIIRKNRTGGQSMMYARNAEDGSRSHAEISVYGKGQEEYEIQITTSDGKGPSEELLKSLQIRVPENDSEGRIAYTYDESGMKIINENDNEESYAVRFFYGKEQFNKKDYNFVERNAHYLSDHSISDHGVSTGDVQSKTVQYTDEKKHYS